MEMKYNRIDYDFIDTYKMKIVFGRNFSKQYSTDRQACLINETAWKALKWDNPLGKRIDNNNFTIIGVIKDFHPYSIHEKIPPFCMVMNSGNLDDGGVYAIRVKPNDKEKTIAFLRQVFKEYFPDAIIDVKTFDNEMNFGTKGVWEVVEKIFFSFAIIAVLIAANGLFGMISFSAQRRMKEIGIRKVFGAGSPHLYIIMSKEFFLILLFSAFIAFPSGYLISHTTPGAYKYQMQFMDYFFAIGIMILTAFVATVYHTTKAILSNPVETLKYE
jgi:putative ABC transport system permease protein